MEDFVIKCEFCQQTPFEVVESNCCSTIYCWNCILEKKICKCGSIINIEKVAVVPELQEILDQNTLDYCKLPGCNYTANRKLIREHVNNCEYRVVSCPSHADCGTFIFKNLVDHQEVCPYAFVNCECGQVVLRQQLMNHNNCPESLVDCKCGIQVKNRFMRDHLFHCPEVIIDCPFAKYGCLYKDSRANVNIHLNEAQESHLQSLENYDYKKEQEIKRLNAQINLPLSTQVCNVTKQVTRSVVTTIPESRLVKRGLHLVDNCRKETLFKILFFFFLATLLPMKFFLVRFIFTTIVMRKVWVVLFGPAIRSARYSRTCTAAVEQMIYLALFIILTVLFAFYSKFL